MMDTVYGRTPKINLYHSLTCGSDTTKVESAKVINILRLDWLIVTMAKHMTIHTSAAQGQAIGPLCDDQPSQHQYISVEASVKD